MPFVPIQGCPKCQGLAEGVPMVTGAVVYTCKQCGNSWVAPAGLK